MILRGIGLSLGMALAVLAGGCGMNMPQDRPCAADWAWSDIEPLVKPVAEFASYRERFDGRPDAAPRKLACQGLLPDPLGPLAGAGPVGSAVDWPARRERIAALLEDWLLGHAPPAPGNVRAVPLDQRQLDGRSEYRVRLEFGPDRRATLSATLSVPNSGGPHPVVLCPWKKLTAKLIDTPAGAKLAFCRYGAKDFDDESQAYADLFGDYDWSAFRRRGWSASRVIDWLADSGLVDPNAIFALGHSRSAKQLMVAAAYDQRIAGVIASSPGSGGSMPFRLCDGTVFGESIEILTRTFPDWVLPRVRYFTGRPNRLPVDSHLIYSLIAPRPVLMSTATYDWVESTWAVEQVHQSLLPVWQLLDAGENLALRYRPEQHTFGPETARDFTEFVTRVAGGDATPADLHPFRPLHPWDYPAWAAKHGRDVNLDSLPDRTATPVPACDATDWAEQRDDIRRRALDLLGDGPAYQPVAPTFDRGESDRQAEMMVRNFPDPPQRRKLTFGRGIEGYLYYPPDGAPGDGIRRPAVVWLSPFACSSGYTGTYRAPDAPLTHLALADAGFVVLAFDPIATGYRQRERRDFYNRHPAWSLMGKMVRDARHALDALADCDDVDRERIYLMGYAMGGMSAAFTAALDDRPAGAALIAGVRPFRRDHAGHGTGGLRRWSHTLGWIPRLGPYIDQPGKVPVDFPELLAAAAPRPTLVVQPRFDWHVVNAHVRDAVEQARPAYRLLNAAEALQRAEPNDWNRLSVAMHRLAIEWLSAQAGLNAPPPAAP